MADPNHSLGDRRDQRERDQQEINRQITEATNLITSNCQQPLAIVGTLLQAWGKGLSSMAEGFEEVRLQQEQQERQQQERQYAGQRRSV